MRCWLAWVFICLPFGHRPVYYLDEPAPYCPRCERWYTEDFTDREADILAGFWEEERT
jgi:hypothetical protein